MDIENKQHIKKVYTDKACNLLKICIVISLLSLSSYFIAIFLYNSFDFGLIFEIISFIFIVIALKKIKQDNISSGKSYIIIAMIPIGWLIIYDFTHLLVNINEVMSEVITYYTSLDQYFYYIEPYLSDVTLIATILLLYKTYRSLSKSDGSKKIENFEDNFYDTL